MKKLIEYMIKNRVAANVLFLVLAVGGGLMGWTMQREVFPEVAPNRILVTVLYPGAPPSEIARSVCQALEESVTGIDGVEKVRCLANEGVGLLIVELFQDASIDDVMNDVESKIGQIQTFPADAKQARVAKVEARNKLISLILYGDLKQIELQSIARKMKADLLALPSLSRVQFSMERNFVMAIEVPESQLQSYGMSLSEITRRVREFLINLPAGELETEQTNFQVRTEEREQTTEELKKIPILTTPKGGVVRLGDLADISYQIMDDDVESFFDGKRAVRLDVYQVGAQNPTQVAEDVMNFIAEKRQEMPPTLQMATWNNQSDLLKSRFRLLLKNAFIGLVLVMALLAVFLEIKLAFWVMAGMAAAFLGGFFLIRLTDVTINMMTLFAFILVLGLLVDDAIVVGENIFQETEQGSTPEAAAVNGTITIIKPVVFAVLTTMLAFVPLLFIQGNVRDFLRPIPVVVISILFISLIESTLVLPAHVAHSAHIQWRWLKPFHRLRNWFDGKLKGFIHGPFDRSLRFVLQQSRAFIAFFIVLLLLAAAAVMGKVIHFVLLPTIEGDEIIVNLTMYPGTPMTRTHEVIKSMESVMGGILMPARENSNQQLSRFKAQELEHTYIILGSQVQERGGPEAALPGAMSSHKAQIRFLFQSADQRETNLTDLGNVFKRRIPQVPGVQSIEVQSSLVDLAKDIYLEYSHPDSQVLEKIVAETQAALTAKDGVYDIKDTLSGGSREIEFKLNTLGAIMGLSDTLLANELRGAFHGLEALRFQRGENEVRVLVRYPKQKNQELAKLGNMRLVSPQGQQAPLLDITQSRYGRSFEEIQRVNGQRVVSVTAQVDRSVTTSADVVNQLQRNFIPTLKEKYPELRVSWEGEAREQLLSLRSLAIGFGLALLVIYAILAVLFQSYFIPVIIMSIIPFGFIGALIGHMIMGFNLSFLSLFGIVGLSGVVINDSLILIDVIQQKMTTADKSADRLVNAAKQRFRPILLTSLTTFAGLTPLIFEGSVQAQFLIPMAISLGIGILFTTFILLYLVPLLYQYYMNFESRDAEPVEGQAAFREA